LLRSMTAFARGQSSGENDDFLIEIHSVNSRRLEIVTNLPGELTEFDPPLRKLVSGVISRGRVSVYVSVQPGCSGGQALHVNAQVARRLKHAYDELKELLGYEGDVDFSIIASHADLIVQTTASSDRKKQWAALRSAAETALADLVAMKEAEGENLKKVFDESLAEIEKTVGSISTAAPAGLDRHTEKLRNRIREVAPELSDNEDRLLREIVILADKLDISEEIDRLKSHVAQFRQLTDDPKPCGRTMDFLIQEMNREVNTIGAKADDLKISKLVVHAKVQLEKMREQAQNIE